MSMAACAVSGGGVAGGVAGGGVGGGVGSPSARARRRPDCGHSVSSRSGLGDGSGPSSRGNGSSTPSDDSDDASHCICLNTANNTGRRRKPSVKTDRFPHIAQFSRHSMLSRGSQFSNFPIGGK